MRRIGIVLGLLGVLALVLVPAAWSERLMQPGEAPATTVRNYPSAFLPCNSTLQACLSGSSAGDVINVAANTYITGLLVITKSVVLQGTGAGPGGTILRPDGSHGVLSLGSSIAAGVVISNLSVFS